MTVIIGLMLAAFATIVWNRNAIRAEWYARKLAQAENPADVAYSASSLAALGEAALRPATRLLDNPRPDIRVLATLIVGRLSGPKAATAMIRSLSDKDLDVRVSAAAQLGLMRDGAQFVGQLTDLARAGPPDSGMAAIVALEKVATAGAALSLRSLAEGHQDPAIRAQAVESLGRRRDPESIPVLVSRLQDTSPVETQLLGEFRDDRVLAEILRRGAALPAAESKPAHRTVADFAERSLEQITGKTFTPINNDRSIQARMKYWQNTYPLHPASMPADLVFPTSE